MPLPPNRAHGPIVHAIRHARGLRLGDLATITDKSKGHLSHVEGGRYRASPALTVKLAAALGVRPEILTGQRPALATLRILLGVDAGELAHDVGITVEHLDALEGGLDRPLPDELTRIARRLGVDPAALDTTDSDAASAAS